VIVSVLELDSVPLVIGERYSLVAFQFVACLTVSCADATPPPSVVDSSTTRVEDPGPTTEAALTAERSPNALSSPPPTGGLTPLEVRDTVVARAGSFQACYEQGLGRDPALVGAVVISARVELDGSVSAVTPVYPTSKAATTSQIAPPPATTLPDRTVVECVVGVFKSLRFRVAEKATVFSFPFVFKGKPSAAPAPPP